MAARVSGIWRTGSTRCGFSILMLVFGISPWWLVLSFGMFYVLYVVEWLVKLCFYGTEAYKNISFEREANAGEEDETYLENCGYFEWVKFIRKAK